MPEAAAPSKPTRPRDPPPPGRGLPRADGAACVRATDARTAVMSAEGSSPEPGRRAGEARPGRNGGPASGTAGRGAYAAAYSMVDFVPER